MQSSPAMANNSVAPAPAPSEAAMNDSKPKKKGFIRRMLNNRDGWVKRFARQDLPGWSPIITAKMVVLFYLLSALILLPLGGAILAASLNVKEYSVRPSPMAPLYHGSVHDDVLLNVAFTTQRRCLLRCCAVASGTLVHTQARYDNVGVFAGATDADRLATFNSNTIASNGNGSPVSVTITAKKTMKAPVRWHTHATAWRHGTPPHPVTGRFSTAHPGSCAGVCVLSAQQLLSELPTVRLSPLLHSKLQPPVCTACRPIVSSRALCCIPRISSFPVPQILLL